MTAAERSGETDAPDPRGRTTFRKRLPMAVVGLGLMGGTIWLLQHEALPLLPPKEALERVDAAMLAGFIALTLGGLLLRAIRFRWLLTAAQSPRVARLLAINLVFFASNIVLPLRLGELVRPLLLQRTRRLTYLEALTLSGAERVADGCASSSLLVAALIESAGRRHTGSIGGQPSGVSELDLQPLVDAIPAAGYASGATFVAAVLCLYAFHRWQSVSAALVRRGLTPISERLAERLCRALSTMAEALSCLRDSGRRTRFLTATVGYWLVQTLSIWVALRACGLSNADFAQSAVVVGVLCLGLMVPSGPGFFGNYQLSVYAALLLFFPRPSVLHEGAGAVFCMYTVQVGACLLLGAVAYLWLTVAERGKRAEAPR